MRRNEFVQRFDLVSCRRRERCRTVKRSKNSVLDGYVILRDVASGSGSRGSPQARFVHSWTDRPGERASFSAIGRRRVHNILAKTRAVDLLVAHPAVLELLRGTLIQPQVSIVNAIEIHPARDGSVSSPGRRGVSDRSSPPAPDRQHHVGPNRVHPPEWRNPPGAAQSGRDRVGRKSFDRDRGDGTRVGPRLVWRALPRRGCQLRANDRASD